MSNVTEFSYGTEVVTAVMMMPLGTGECFDGPIAIGYYVGDSTEIWIEHEGARLNIQRAHLAAFIKQLKRADKIVSEVA